MTTFSGKRPWLNCCLQGNALIEEPLVRVPGVPGAGIKLDQYGNISAGTMTKILWPFLIIDFPTGCVPI
jgi:hypothetical protein